MIIDKTLPNNVKAKDDEWFTNSMLLPFLKKIRQVLNFGLIPVGMVVTLGIDDDPADVFGYGTWEEIAKSRVLVGKEPALSEFDTIGKTGGALTHLHTVAAHQHELPFNFDTSGLKVYLADAAEFGSSRQGTPIATMSTSGAATYPSLKSFLDSGSITSSSSSVQPYYVVRRWIRTA